MTTAIKDAPEVITVGENFVLVRQVGTTAVYQIYTRQVILLCDFLRS
jgi:hypothetical protein